jgi:CheY-like chemotaxis protein
VTGTDETRPVTVLYIEDNASNVELMAEVLRRHGGAHLLVATDGQSGLALAARHRPDLVLLDLHLPDLTGEEVLHRLQPSAATVVAVSADATRAQIDRVLALGAATYVTKPFDVSVIGRLVDGCRTDDQGAAAG